MLLGAMNSSAAASWSVNWVPTLTAICWILGLAALTFRPSSRALMSADPKGGDKPLLSKLAPGGSGCQFAHSVDRDRPIRPNVITESGDRDHALAWCHGGQWRAAWPGSGRCH